MIGQPHLLGERQLRGDTGPHLRFGQVVALHRSRDLRRQIGGDDDERTERFSESHLDEQRHLVAGERLSLALELRHALALPGLNERMRDGLEAPAGGRVLEDASPQAPPVELAPLVEHLGAELRHDGREARRARADDLTRKLVGVDDGQPTRGKARGDDALARGEPTGEAEDMHEDARSLPFPEHPFKWGMRFGIPRRLGPVLAASVAALGCAASGPSPHAGGPRSGSPNGELAPGFGSGAPLTRSSDAPPAQVFWSYRAGAPLAAPPGIGSDGSVVVGSVDGYLHALRGDGSFRWGYTLRGPVVGRPAMGPRGAVFAAADPNGLYALDGEGTLLWVSSVAGGVSSPAVVDQSSKVWVATGQGTVLGFSAHGGLVGFARIGTSPTLGPAVLPGGGVVVGNTDGKLRILGPTSASGRAVESSPIVELDVGKDGLFLLGAEGLSRLDATNGVERWSRLAVERVACASPALVVVEAQGLRWLSAEGEPRARVALPVGEHRAVACLSDGSLVVPDDTGLLLRVDASGIRARARMPAGSLVSLDPTGGGLLIAGYRDGRVLAIRPPG